MKGVPGVSAVLDTTGACLSRANCFFAAFLLAAAAAAVGEVEPACCVLLRLRASVVNDFCVRGDATAWQTDKAGAHAAWQ
jgi:hypothetical protein